LLSVRETGPDGAFSTDLPPGVYDLRGERGRVIHSRIVVEGDSLALGSVHQRACMSPFHHQGVVRGIVTTPAPSTANIPLVEQSGEQSEGGAPASAAPAQSPPVPAASK
jgi:hypothetical protein